MKNSRLHMELEFECIRYHSAPKEIGLEQQTHRKINGIDRKPAMTHDSAMFYHPNIAEIPAIGRYFSKFWHEQDPNHNQSLWQHFCNTCTAVSTTMPQSQRFQITVCHFSWLVRGRWPLGASKCSHYSLITQLVLSSKLTQLCRICRPIQNWGMSNFTGWSVFHGRRSC